MNYRRIVGLLVISGGLAFVPQGTASAAKYTKTLPKNYSGIWYAYAGKTTLKQQSGLLFNVYLLGGHNMLTQTRFVDNQKNQEIATVSTPMKYRRVVNPKTKKVSYLMHLTSSGGAIKVWRTKVQVGHSKRVAMAMKTGSLKFYLFRIPVRSHSIKKELTKVLQLQ